MSHILIKTTIKTCSTSQIIPCVFTMKLSILPNAMPSRRTQCSDRNLLPARSKRSRRGTGGLRLCGILTIAWMAASSLQAQIVARFADGNTENEVDGYKGKAGNGWSTAWEQRGYASSGSASAAIGSISVVNDGTLWDTNRLKVTPSNNATGTGASVGRAYNRVYEDFDAGNPVEISFRFSFDDLGSFLSTSSNNIFIGENTANSGNPTSGTAWFLLGFGGTSYNAAPTGSSSYATARQGQWNLSLGPTGYVPTGIRLQADVLYTFTLSIYPSTGAGVDSTYTVHLTNGTNSFQSGILKFRNEKELGGMLVFAETYASGQGATFSIGNISISQIPEPSSVALLLVPLTTIGLTAYRQRRHQA